MTVYGEEDLTERARRMIEEGLGLAVVKGWITQTTARAEYREALGGRAHAAQLFRLAQQVKDAATDLKDALAREDASEPPRHDPKRSGIAPEKPGKP
jgi:hypothetical protein